MRLIDADAIKEKIDSMWNGRPISFLGARILAMIDKAPTIDAVSVVRCKECKHYDDGDCEHPCSEVGDSPLLVKADDFCSYAERREP